MATQVTFNKRIPPGKARGTLAELMAKQGAASQAAQSATSMDSPTIMQGFGKLGMIGANVFKEKRAERGESEARARIAKIIAGIPDTGADAQTIANLGMDDPELAETYRQEAVAARAVAAERANVLADRDNTRAYEATIDTREEGQAIASEGRASGREAGINTRELEETKAAEVRAAEQAAADTAAKAAAGQQRIVTGEEAVKLGGDPGRQYQVSADGTSLTDVTPKVADGIDVTVNNAASNADELWKKFNTDMGANFAGYMKDSANAGAQLRGLEILDQIDPAAQGPLVGRLAEMFPGVSSQAALFESVVRRMAPQERVEGSGAQSDLEYKGLIATWPQLKNMPGANKAVTAAIRAQAAIAQERAAIITEMYGKPFDQTQDGLRKLLELDQRSILTPELASAITAIQADQPIPEITITPGEDAEADELIKKARGLP